MMKKILFIFMTILIAGLSFNYQSFAENKPDGNVCDNEYVLCTSAPCIPDPSNPDTKAICACEVNKGLNYGYSECDGAHAQDRRERRYKSALDLLVRSGFWKSGSRPVPRVSPGPTVLTSRVSWTQKTQQRLFARAKSSVTRRLSHMEAAAIH